MMYVGEMIRIIQRVMSGMEIEILSDTHGLIRPEVTDALIGNDVILHAGDINKESMR